MRDRRTTGLECRGQAPPYRPDYGDGLGTWGGSDHGLSLQGFPPARLVHGAGASRPCARGSG